MLEKTFSIIGQGFIFPRHIQAIASIGGKFVDIISDSRYDKDWVGMIDTTKANYVVVLTPNDLHFEMILRAVEKGKIVLCEKPLTIDTSEVKRFLNSDKVFTVLQLRHHPLAKQLKEQIKPSEDYKIEMDISVFRDKDYFTGWKGDEQRSGGILYNLGIHYFDLLLWLFGEAEKVQTDFLGEKLASGAIEGKNYRCEWRICSNAPKDRQQRTFKINGIDYNFSSQDNLSFEDLHKFVYQDLIQGKGITTREALKSMELIEKIKNEKV